MIFLVETNVRFLHLVHFSGCDAGFCTPTQLDVHATGPPTGNRLSHIRSGEQGKISLGESEKAGRVLSRL